MAATDTTNPYFALADTFVNQTGQSIFLTGKAGTGKTTFLRHIKGSTFKKAVIVAPTGVAAINAGGVTIHSLFGVPPGPFVPSLHSGWDSHALNKQSLFHHIRLNKAKRELLQELELLIIDEVSMVRADLLDAVDTILRHIRHQASLPFGGVQVLFIGDLFQLPPVTNAEDWELLKPYYKSPFFFDAEVLADNPPVFIELKKIYRQSDAFFIDLLNNVRNNCLTAADFALLQQHYRPGFQVPDSPPYITLASHNARADDINQQQLQKLPGQPHRFTAEVRGDFNEKAYPAEEVLLLKEGAQVMFIKNDKGETRRYYNGKLATVARIEEEKIWVCFSGEEGELQVDREIWRNIRYQYSRDTDEVGEEELGSFSQYPLRLAWAITIHKSQGLTFQRAIVDAGASFAPGQVYVALSRLTDLKGLVLRSAITPNAISTDERVLAFSEKETGMAELQQLLEKERGYFVEQLLVKSFNWDKLVSALQEFHAGFENRLIPDKSEAAQWAHTLVEELLAQQAVAQKFGRQLEQLLTTARADNYQTLHQRVVAAVDYFNIAVVKSLEAVKGQIATYKIKQRSKKYVTELRDMALLLERKRIQLQQSAAIAEGLLKGQDTGHLLQEVEALHTLPSEALPETVEAKEGKARPPKGESQRISLALFTEGQTIEAIAQARGLAIGTVEGHLASFVKTGELAVNVLVPPSKLPVIDQAIQDNPEAGNTALKEILGEGFSYGEIRAVLNHREWLAQQAAQDQS
jgi:DNA-binding NarL/FixJ family response regulator